MSRPRTSNRLVFFCSIATSLAACSASRRPALVSIELAGSNTGSLTPVRAAELAATAVSPQLQARFESMAAGLAPERARFAGVVSHGFLAQGARHSVALDVPAGRCLSLVSIASAPVRDLDARLFSPDGETLAEDTEPDPHPTVQLCASEARRVFLVLDAYDGQGAFAVGVFEARDRAALDAMATVLGGRPSTAVSTGATMSDGERHLAEMREGISRRGFTPSGELQRVDFRGPGSAHVAVEALAARCYTIVAFADQGVRDVDLRVRDARGVEIARDVRRERDALLQVCPSENSMLSAEVIVREGVEGAVLVQAFAAEAAVVGGANALWLGERTGWLASGAPVRDLEQRLGRAAEAMNLRPEPRPAGTTALAGRLSAGEVRDIALGPAPDAVAPVTCTAVALVGGPGLGRVRLELLTPTSGPRAADAIAGGDGAAVAAWCGPASRTVLRARVRAEVGAGEYAVSRFQRAAPAGVDPSLAAQDLAIELAARDAGYTPAGPAEAIRVGARSLRVSESSLAEGECGLFALSTANGGGRLTLRVENGSAGDTLEVRPHGPVVVPHCAERAAERLSLELAAEPEWAPESAAQWRVFRRAR